MIDAQVLIVGAGPGGCATALALLGAGIGGVVLVDKPVRAPFRIGESATPDVPGLLRRLGLPGDLGAAGHRPCHANLSLWGGVRVVDDFLRRGQGHGWHLDRAAFDAALRHAAVARGARLVTPASVSALARRDGHWQVDMDGGEGVRAPIIVDAAGRRSPLARRLGVVRRKLDHLVALATHAPAAAELAGMTLVEPFADGWWYAAPLPDGRAIVTLMTDADLARAAGWNRPAAYRRAWAASSELCRRLTPPAGDFPVATFAAHSGFLTQAAGPGWLAVGDALIGFDPLTSSGIAGALSDALAAADTIRQWLASPQQAATAAATYARRADAAVRRYLAERQAHYRGERRWTGRAFWARRAGDLAG